MKGMMETGFKKGDLIRLVTNHSDATGIILEIETLNVTEPLYKDLGGGGARVLFNNRIFSVPICYLEHAGKPRPDHAQIAKHYSSLFDRAEQVDVELWLKGQEKPLYLEKSLELTIKGSPWVDDLWGKTLKC